MSTRHAVWVLGAGQCVYWGILYYAFSVLQLPMASSLHCSPAWIAAAYSIGLAVTGLLAPIVGRWLDRGAGTQAMRIGALVAGLLVFAWSWVTTLPTLYLLWVALGATMATLLYEPAFALVRESTPDPHIRARSIAMVTIFGGMASTVFLPLTAILVKHLTWTGALRWLALLILLTALCVDRLGLRPLQVQRGTRADAAVATSEAPTRHRGTPPGFGRLRAVFFASMLANVALTVQLIPALVARGYSGETAATILAVMGITQLPGRLFVFSGRLLPGVSWLLAVPLLLQAGGLLVLVIPVPATLAALGVATFGVGAGLNTLARPLAIQALYGTTGAGRFNGDLARAQHVARALGPVAFSSIYLWGGSALTFGGTALGLIVLAIAVRWRPPLEVAPASAIPSTCPGEPEVSTYQ